MTFLSIRQLVRMNSLIRQLVCMTLATHQPVCMTFLIFLIHQIVRMIFAIRQLAHMNSEIRQLVRMSFLIRQLVRIVPVIFSRVVSSTAFTVCALTKYTPPCLISGSCPLPNLKNNFFAECVSTPCSHSRFTLKIGFVTFTTWKSYRFV